MIYVFIYFLYSFSLCCIAPQSFCLHTVRDVIYKEEHSFSQFFEDIRYRARQGPFEDSDFAYFEDLFRMTYRPCQRVIVEVFKTAFLSLEEESARTENFVTNFLYKLFIKCRALELLEYCPLLEDRQDIAEILISFRDYSDNEADDAIEAIRHIVSPLKYRFFFEDYSEGETENSSMDDRPEPLLDQCSYLWGKVLWDEIRQSNPSLNILLDWALFPELPDMNKKENSKILLSLQLSSLRFVLNGIVDPKNCDGFGNTILHFFMLKYVHNSEETIEALIKLYPEFLSVYNASGLTPIHLAVSHYPEFFLYLIEKDYFSLGEESESRTVLGLTYLHLAAEGRHHSVVRFLCDRGYSVRTRDYKGWTPLHWAVAKNFNCDECDYELMVLLAPEEQDMNLQDDHGNTALHIAVQRGSAELIERLVKKGADPFVQNKKGRTLIHEWVLRDTFFQDWTFLISLCDDDLLNVHDHEGHSCLHLAVQDVKKEALGALFLRLDMKRIYNLLFYMIDEKCIEGMDTFLMQVESQDFVWSKESMEDILNYAQKKKEPRFFLMILECIYTDLSSAEKKQWTDVFFDIFENSPETLSAFDASIFIKNTDLREDLQDPFINMCVRKKIPIRLELMEIYGFTERQLFQFLDKIPMEYSLVSRDFGTTLMFCIHKHCASDDMTSVCHKLISKGFGVNELTAHGTPLSHLLYIMAVRMRGEPSRVKQCSYPLIQALLEAYSPEVVIRKGQALDPEEANRQHEGIRRDIFLEYGEEAIFATLRTKYPSQDLYDMVKEKVALTNRNGFKRNFIHHLSLIDSRFENDLKGLFKRRHLSDDQVQTLINQKDVDGMTPLMYAASNPQMLDQLLTLGADYDAVDKRGFSIRHHLFLVGHKETLRVFLKKMNIFLKEGESFGELRRQCGVDLNAPVSLSVSFKDQVRHLVIGDKRLLSLYPGIDHWVLSTHHDFSRSFSVHLRHMLDKNFYQENGEKIVVGVESPVIRELSSEKKSEIFVGNRGFSKAS